MVRIEIQPWVLICEASLRFFLWKMCCCYMYFVKTLRQHLNQDARKQQRLLPPTPLHLSSRPPLFPISSPLSLRANMYYFLSDVTFSAQATLLSPIFLRRGRSLMRFDGRSYPFFFSHDVNDQTFLAGFHTSLLHVYYHWLRRFCFSFKLFPLGDHFLNSHDLSAWLCINIVRRNWMFISAETGLVATRQENFKKHESPFLTLLRQGQ